MSLNVERKLKLFFDKFFWGQHPDSALRYLPAVSAIRKNKLAKSKILEVGSGSLGITPYLKVPIDGVDFDFAGPQTDLLRKIKGSAENLPFRANSYDVVIAVDVIEHLAPALRQKAIDQMLRVARRFVIIVLPVGKLSELQDRELALRWRQKFRQNNQFLKEHVKHGLPTVGEVLVMIDKAARMLNKKTKIKSRPLLNLRVRNILMKTWITRNRLIYYLYLKGYLLFLPLLKLANFGNCYRRLFVIELVPPKSGKV